MDRLLLIRHAATPATRRAAFPADEPLDPQAFATASRLREVLPSVDTAFSSPSLRATQTAAAADLADPDPDLAECDFGRWTSLTLEEVHARDPDGLRAWFEDPEAAPHGGESQAGMAARILHFLDRASGGTTVAITHGGVVKAAVIEVLRAPFSAFWRLDVAPLSITELRRHDGTWTVSRTNWSVG